MVVDKEIGVTVLRECYDSPQLPRYFQLFGNALHSSSSKGPVMLADSRVRYAATTPSSPPS